MSPFAKVRAPTYVVVRALLLPLALLVIAGNPSANIFPEASIFAHVQPEDPTYCETCPITTCEEIVQFTPQLGRLEFDLFYHTLLDIGRPEELFVIVQLPPDWSFESFECCVPGSASAELVGYMLEIQILPTIDIGTFDLVCRLVLDAPDFGWLGYAQGYVITDDGEGHYLYGFGGEAGRNCGTCTVACDFDFGCIPRLSPDELDLEVAAGGIVYAELMGHGLDPCSGPCAAEFAVTEEWMALDVVELGVGNYLLTLTVDATGLDPGEYVGWIEDITADCSRCAEVEVLVTGATPTRARTWGFLKGLYR